jgi:hypothetical protein
MHVSGRNHPNELVGISQGKGDVQRPAFNGLTESMKAQHQQWGIEKNLHRSENVAFDAISRATVPILGRAC